ncbi:MAG: 50S ribosomal protein L23 [SAR324 cluster bacterium]|nr:50S ribosomal protein L23 [SAR324 cluster bacterium]
MFSVLVFKTFIVGLNKTRLGRHEGRKSNWKKALVRLKAGETIEFFEGA